MAQKKLNFSFKLVKTSAEWQRYFSLKYNNFELLSSFSISYRSSLVFKKRTVKCKQMKFTKKGNH